MARRVSVDGVKLTGSLSTTALFRTDVAQEVLGADPGTSLFMTTNPGVLGAHEVFNIFGGYDAGGNIAKLGSTSYKFAVVTAANSAGVLRLNATYYTAGVAAEDIAFRLFANRGIEIFGPDDVTWPGANRIRVRGKLGIGSLADFGRTSSFAAETGTDLIVQFARQANTKFNVLEFNTGATQDWLVGEFTSGSSDFEFYSPTLTAVVLKIAKATGFPTFNAPNIIAIVKDSGTGYALLRVQSRNGSGTYGDLMLGAAGNTNDLATGTAQGDVVVGNGNAGKMLLLTGGAARGQVTALGSLVWGTAALATTATDGFIYMTTSAGAPTGAPTAFTGRFPIHYDSTNNQIYVYNGAWKKTVALT